MLYNTIPLMLRSFHSIIDASVERIKLMKKKLIFIYRIAFVSGLFHYYETLPSYCDGLEWDLNAFKSYISDAEQEVSQLTAEVDSFDNLIKDCQKENFALREKLKVSDSLEQPLSELKSSWIYYHINRINQDSYGSGHFYELYDSRRQSAIDRLIEANKADLTEAEINKIKQEEYSRYMLLHAC